MSPTTTRRRRPLRSARRVQNATARGLRRDARPRDAAGRAFFASPDAGLFLCFSFLGIVVHESSPMTDSARSSPRPKVERRRRLAVLAQGQQPRA